MDDDERAKLVRDLSKDVENFIANLKPTKYTDGWPEDRWEEEMEKHPAFMTKSADFGHELPPLVEAMQQLKYDPEFNTPMEIAMAYKEDGNINYQRKKYQWAIDSYTEGLKAKCEDKELNAILYGNRATSHYAMGNYKKALDDATEAKNLNPAYFRAISRGALCCLELKLYEKCISWCDEGLKLNADDATLLGTKKKAQSFKEKAYLSKKEADIQQWKESLELKKLNKTIEKRGIRVNYKGGFTAKSLEPLPEAGGAKVHLTSEGVLIWPVIFLYPEHNVSEFIQAFDEHTCFYDQFVDIFKEPAPWDTEQKYIPEKLQVYFSDGDAAYPVDKNQPLLSAMRHPKFQLEGGVLTFFVTVENSAFDDNYRKRHL